MKNLLSELEEQGNYRYLNTVSTDSKYLYSASGDKMLNFSSNDYLALSDAKIQKQFFNELNCDDEFIMSNPSSRLMCGNTFDYVKLEKGLSDMFGADSAIVLSCGFMVNAGVLPAITTPKDFIIADKKVHASIIEGMTLSKATSMRYAHNSMEHLETLLEKYSGGEGEIWVVTESVFSMDGDIAPLREIMELKKKYGFRLYIDEAHAFGVRGKTGCGILEEYGFKSTDIDIIVATLGKAAASAGGFVISNSYIRELLVNRMRTLIFSTAIPPISLKWSDYIIERIADMSDRREHIDRLRHLASEELSETFDSHIIPIIIGDNFKTLEMVKKLAENGYFVSAVRYPTVPKGESRIRVSLSAAMSETEVIEFLNCVKRCR